MEAERVEVPVEDPIFGKSQPRAGKGDVESALDLAWAALFGGATKRPLDWSPPDNIGTASHSRIHQAWQKQCRLLPDVLQAEQVLAGRKWDVRDYPARDLKVEVREQQVEDTTRYHLALAKGEQAGLGITPRGMETLAGWIGVPEEYVSRLLVWGEHDLAVRNVNTLVERRAEGGKGEEQVCTARFIRDGLDENSPSKLRCVASRTYGILNNVDAMEMIAEAFGEAKVLVSHLYNDTNRIYGNLFPEDRAVHIRDDSDYGLGIAFRNGECLESAYAVQPFLYRYT